MGFISWWGRFPGGGNGNPLQYSYLENPIDRGAWWVTVHGVSEELDTTEWLNNNIRAMLGYKQAKLSSKKTRSWWRNEDMRETVKSMRDNRKRKSMHALRKENGSRQLSCVASLPLKINTDLKSWGILLYVLMCSSIPLFELARWLTVPGNQSCWEHYDFRRN